MKIFAVAADQLMLTLSDKKVQLAFNHYNYVDETVTCLMDRTAVELTFEEIRSLAKGLPENRFRGASND